jgi:serine/threonine-protein kinase
VRTLGRFEILDEIGRGGCGIVFRALDPKIGRHVAIKTILPEGALPPGQSTPGGSSPMTTARSSLYQRLLLEAQSAGRLSHPNIVVIHELDEQDGVTFVVMEYVAGRTLGSLMEDGRPGLDVALTILRQTAAALDHAHQHDVVHRDIKPANILVTAENFVKVTDFGIAKVLKSELGLTQTGAAMGTAFYMAPELIAAKPVSPQTDQFALAVIAFEMFTGRRPFGGDSWPSVLHQILSAEPPPISNYRADLSGQVTAVLRRALAKDAAKRYPSCAEFFRDLNAAVLATPLPLPGRIEGVREEARKKRPSWLAPVLAGAGVAAVGGSIAVYVLSRPSVEAPPAETPPILLAENTPRAEPPVPVDSPRPPSVAERKAPTPQERPAPPNRGEPPAPIAVAAPQTSPKSEPPASPPGEPAQTPPVVEIPASVPAAPRPVIEVAPPKPAPAAVPADERAWAEVAGSRSVAALDQFRRDYPASPRAREALERIAQLEWERVRGSNDPRAINDYLARFPASPQAANARERLRALEGAAAIRQTRPLVDAALERYRLAFEHRSIDELRRVWPGLTRQEQSAFQDFFRNARAVSMELRVQGDPEISADSATVRATRSMQMTSERGREPAQSNPVIIRLRRSGAEMVIESVALGK